MVGNPMVKKKLWGYV